MTITRSALPGLPTGRIRNLAAGRYYAGLTGATTGTGTLGQSVLTLFPTFIDDRTRIDRLAARVSAAVAGATVRLGIYGDSAGLPGNLLLDAGTIDAATAGAKELTVDLTLPPGRYWLGGVSQGGTPGVLHWSSVSAPAVGFAALADLVSAGNVAGLTQSSVTGALPATFTPGGSAGFVLGVFFRAA